ncbi:MAG TPA: hypothetical protein VM621_05515 [Luteibacter sp.]|uniref:hypothetical protein n=1 Tax=Luteibacter sp. TaxID=1886636 RepID=UPI002C0604C3|nr:hypothetical protein [Luteibacter sp.]HVI54495.1 hypothetical protein [Luteibacter sp.]
MRTVFILAFTAILVVVISPALASGGSYLVDDASTATPGRCQLESWLQVFRAGTHTGWTVPACGVGPVEFGIGLGGQSHPGQNMQNPSIKWQLRNGDDAGIGFALATDTTLQNGRRIGTNAYAASNFGIDDGRRLMANVNLGMTQARDGAWRRLTGVGFEFAVTKDLALLVERLWTARLSQTTQAGARFYFGKDDGDSVDFVVGRARARALPTSRWATIGLNLAF